MARRGQTINVKVQRKKVIVALEKALKKLDADYASKDKNEKAFEKEQDAWLKNVYNGLKSKQPTGIEIYYNHIDVRFSLPDNFKDDKPERNFETMHDWQYKDNKEELENAIRILNMCEDEYISTATYGAISKYL